MKIIIDIPKEAYEYVKATSYLGWLTTGEYAYVIQNGIPLDDVKAEIEKQIERDFAFSETETLKVPCHYGIANGLQNAIRILDNIGKAESEDKE